MKKIKIKKELADIISDEDTIRKAAILGAEDQNIKQRKHEEELMTHQNFKRCQNCGEEIHVIDNKEVGHMEPCEDYEAEKSI